MKKTIMNHNNFEGIIVFSGEPVQLTSTCFAIIKIIQIQRIISKYKYRRSFVSSVLYNHRWIIDIAGSSRLNMNTGRMNKEDCKTDYKLL